jgi:hypothetical protein
MILTRKDVNSIAREILYENLSATAQDLKAFSLKNGEAEQALTDAYSCDNVKLLEVIMEHLLFHWDDITQVLVDELLEEEALERNRIELRHLKD